MVRNPFRPSQAYRVSLEPADVRTIFFWTRWPIPMLDHLDNLDKRSLPSIFHVTLTGLPAPLEPQLHSEAERVDAIKALARRTAAERVWWRYDPIILGEHFSPGWHEATFSRLAAALEGSTVRVTLSLLDWYRKTERRLRGAGAGTLHRLEGQEPVVLDLLARLAGIARSHGMEPVSCSEPGWEAAGLKPASCIDGEAAASLFHFAHEEGKDPGQRKHCRCSPSWDVGATNTCIGGCLYCYSTASHERALANYSAHAPGADEL